MNSDPPSVRVRLNDDGELRDGKFCAHCGQIGLRGSKVCEHCGEPFPVPLTALRLRLEALRQSEEKKKELAGSERRIRGLFYRVVLMLVLVFALVIFAILFVARSEDMRGYSMRYQIPLGTHASPALTLRFPYFIGPRGDYIEGVPDGSSGRLPIGAALVAFIALVGQMYHYAPYICDSPARLNPIDLS